MCVCVCVFKCVFVYSADDIEIDSVECKCECLERFVGVCGHASVLGVFSTIFIAAAAAAAVTALPTSLR